MERIAGGNVKRSTEESAERIMEGSIERSVEE